MLGSSIGQKCTLVSCLEKLLDMHDLCHHLSCNDYYWHAWTYFSDLSMHYFEFIKPTPVWTDQYHGNTEGGSAMLLSIMSSNLSHQSWIISVAWDHIIVLTNSIWSDKAIQWSLWDVQLSDADLLPKILWISNCELWICYLRGIYDIVSFSMYWVQFWFKVWHVPICCI